MDEMSALVEELGRLLHRPTPQQSAAEGRGPSDNTSTHLQTTLKSFVEKAFNDTQVTLAEIPDPVGVQLLNERGITNVKLLLQTVRLKTTSKSNEPKRVELSLMLDLKETVQSFKPKRTLLQYAVGEPQYFAGVDHLVNTVKVDPNQVAEDPQPPLILAAEAVNVEAIGVLMAAENIRFDAVKFTFEPASKWTALHCVTLRLIGNKFDVEMEDRFVECLERLIPKEVADDHNVNSAIVKYINSKDFRSYTALHYAARAGWDRGVRVLLERGAYLAIENDRRETALQHVSPTTLEQFFDSLVTVDDEDVDKCKVTFNYRNIVASPGRGHDPATERHDDVEMSSITTNTVEAVDPGRQADSQTVSSQDHLRSDALWHMSQSKRHQHLLRHPLVTSFLAVRWHRLRWFYYVNFFVYIYAVAVFTCFHLGPHSGWDFVKTLSWIAVGLVGLRESAHFAVLRGRYFISCQHGCLENYVVVVVPMLGLTTYLLVGEDAGQRRHLSALAVLFTWIELSRLVGRHPRLSLYVKMLKEVTLKCILLIASCSALLFGFACSFFLVFASPPGSGNSSSPQCETKLFNTLPGSVLKMAAMMSGEVTVDGLPFDAANYAVAVVLFVAFFVVVVIALFNVLIGLAVSDVQKLKDKAETLKYVDQVRFVTYMEAALRVSHLPSQYIRQFAFGNINTTTLEYTVSQTTNADCKDWFTCLTTFKLPEKTIKIARQRASEHYQRSQRKVANDGIEEKLNAIMERLQAWEGQP